MNAIINAPLTMTSLEIAELLDVRHDSVKRTIERLAEPGIIARPPTEDVQMKGGNNRTYTTQVYVFSGERGKRDSIVVVAQLSPEFTARLVDRWQELEEQQLEAIAHPPMATGLAAVREARYSFGESVARQLWLKLGLPTVPGMFERERAAQLELFVRIG